MDRLEPELAGAGTALNIYAEIGRSKIFFVLKFEFLGLRLARFQNFIKFGPVFKRQKRTKNGGLQKYANENEALTQRAILIYFYLLEKLSYLLTMTMLVMVWQEAYGKGRMARGVWQGASIPSWGVQVGRRQPQDVRLADGYP